MLHTDTFTVISGNPFNAEKATRVLALTHHVRRLGTAALDLIDSHGPLVAAPTIRSGYECALTAMWIAQSTDAVQTWTAQDPAHGQGDHPPGRSGSGKTNGEVCPNRRETERIQVRHQPWNGYQQPSALHLARRNEPRNSPCGSRTSTKRPLTSNRSEHGRPSRVSHAHELPPRSVARSGRSTSTTTIRVRAAITVVMDPRLAGFFSARMSTAAQRVRLRELMISRVEPRISRFLTHRPTSSVAGRRRPGRGVHPVQQVGVTEQQDVISVVGAEC